MELDRTKQTGHDGVQGAQAYPWRSVPPRLLLHPALQSPCKHWGPSGSGINKPGRSLEAGLGQQLSRPLGAVHRALMPTA